MPFIRVGNKYLAEVDDQDFEWLSRSTWGTSGGYRGNSAPYASRVKVVGGKHKYEAMHRVILGAQPGQYVDHIDGNTLNNRRSNLRLATPQQNARNRRKTVNPTRSRYKGIMAARGCWAAYIFSRSDRKYLGRFATEEDAAFAYDIAAIQYYGEFASLNFDNSRARFLAGDMPVRVTRSDTRSSVSGPRAPYRRQKLRALTPCAALFIRFANDSHLALATRFRVSPGTIRKVRANQIWRFGA